MLLGLLRGMLGPLVVVLDWALANPAWVALPTFLWTIVWYWARMQLLRIEKQTDDLVLQVAREAMAQSPALDSGALYKRVYPIWARSVVGWVPFVPNRLELWPVRPTPEAVAKKLSFSPEWIRSRLARHGIQLSS